MSAIDDGGPAFPIPQQQFTDGYEIVGTEGAPGMTLRDWFAGQALAGLARDVSDDVTTTRTKGIATAAYELADAMLAARKEGK